MVSRVETFKLQPITRQTMIKEIENLNPRKSVSSPISIKALKIAKYYCADILTACFNYHVVDRSEFPDELKLADIIPAYKKDSVAFDKGSYRPFGILPSLSKVIEKLISKQFNPFTEKSFSKKHCGFRKGHSTQHVLN